MTAGKQGVATVQSSSVVDNRRGQDVLSAGLDRRAGAPDHLTWAVVSSWGNWSLVVTPATLSLVGCGEPVGT